MLFISLQMKSFLITFVALQYCRRPKRLFWYGFFFKFQVEIIMQTGAISLVIGTVCGLIIVLSAIADEQCKLFELSMPYSGRYCPADGMVSIDLLPHQCRYICLQSTACKAYNYNATDGACVLFTSPCPLAVTDTMMEFAVFTDKTIHQCYQWLPYSLGVDTDERMIATDASHRIICRMQKAGDDIVCQYNTRSSRCFANLGISSFSSKQGYPCQRLRIMEGCTVFWVPYTARDPIHPRAVIAGHMVNGDTVHVTKFGNNPSVYSLAGHYVEGATHTFGNSGGDFQSSAFMMMLVVL